MISVEESSWQSDCLCGGVPTTTGEREDRSGHDHQEVDRIFAFF